MNTFLRIGTVAALSLALLGAGCANGNSSSTGGNGSGNIPTVTGEPANKEKAYYVCSKTGTNETLYRMQENYEDGSFLLNLYDANGKFVLGKKFKKDEVPSITAEKCTRTTREYFASKMAPAGS